MNYADAITEQTISIQRESDKLLGRDKMNYDEFCEAIDEIIPADMMNMKDGQPLANAREVNKAIGKHIKETVGIPYYNIYLSVKFNIPLK